jgi:hypothetical protein
VNGRTRVGIVEWARRLEAARSAELALADALAARVAEVQAVADKVALVRAARRHGWHAELWRSVIPALHDVVVAGTDRRPGAPGGAVEAHLDADYRAWATEAGPVAEAPIRRVLELVMADHEAVAAP